MILNFKCDQVWPSKQFETTARKRRDIKALKLKKKKLKNKVKEQTIRDVKTWLSLYDKN